jgi:hypothetical protein
VYFDHETFATKRFCRKREMLASMPTENAPAQEEGQGPQPVDPQVNTLQVRLFLKARALEAAVACTDAGKTLVRTQRAQKKALQQMTSAFTSADPNAFKAAQADCVNLEQAFKVASTARRNAEFWLELFDKPWSLHTPGGDGNVPCR